MSAGVREPQGIPSGSMARISSTSGDCLRNSAAAASRPSPELMSAIRMRPTVARRHGAGATCRSCGCWVTCHAHRRQETPPEPTGTAPRAPGALPEAEPHRRPGSPTGSRREPSAGTGARRSPPGAPEQKLPHGKLGGLSVPVGAGLAWIGG
jgi:hypothetical protein